MLKFLRKYSKWILVVGGSLLMVAFLLPQALTQFAGDPGSQTYMRIDGRKITGHRARLAFQEYAALDMLPTGGQGRGGLEIALGIETPDHWLLLTDLAERSGYVGDQRDGEAFFTDAVRQLVSQMLIMSGRGYMLNDPRMAPVIEMMVSSAETNRPDIMAAAQLNDEQFNMALAKLRGVMRMMNARSSADRYSRPRLVAEAKERLDTATIDYVFIDAASRIGQVAEPTDEEIEAHFQAYKDKRPGEGDYGFGYLLPPRVKVEWLTLNQQAIADAMTVDEIEVQTRLLRHMEENAEANEEMAYQMISSQVRAEGVQEVMRLARQAIQLKTDAAQRSLPTDGEFLVLPPDFADKRPTLEQLADAVVERVRQDPRVRVRMPRPTIERHEEWLTAEEISNLEGIGSATLQRGSQQIPFPTVALAVREIAGDLHTGLGLQVGVLRPLPLQDFAGNQYYFRVLDARKESAPDSADEIRDQLVADVKELRAYQALLAERDALLQQAIESGLEAVAQAAVSLESGPLPDEQAGEVRTAQVTPAATIPELNSEAFRDAVMTLARRLDHTQPVEGVDVGQRTVAVGIDESLGLAVAQITGWQPLTQERFRLAGQQVARRMALESSQEADYAPFSFKTLVDRLNVEFPQRQDDEDEADAAGDEAPADSEA